jgi:hypothetical protein
MHFGNPDNFSVEIYHEPSSPQWLGFGRMCVHIQGLTFGVIEEEHCSLFHAVERIGEVANILPSLWDDRFAQHTDEEVFGWLDAMLYSGEISLESEEINRFDFLTNTGEQFDDSKSFILCSPEGVVRILFQLHDRIIVNSASCDAATFLAVSSSLNQWFQAQTRGIAPH